MPEENTPEKVAEAKPVEKTGEGQVSESKPAVKKSVVSQWWFWTIIAVVVIGIGVGAVLLVMNMAKDVVDNVGNNGGNSSDNSGNNDKDNDKDRDNDKDKDNDNGSGSQTDIPSAKGDWREFLKLYEEWVEGYVGFMKKHNGNYYAMATDPEFEKWADALDNWSKNYGEIDTDNMTMAEAQEFYAAAARISEKLSRVYGPGN